MKPGPAISALAMPSFAASSSASHAGEVARRRRPAFLAVRSATLVA